MSMLEFEVLVAWYVIAGTIVGTILGCILALVMFKVFLIVVDLFRIDF